MQDILVNKLPHDIQHQKIIISKGSGTYWTCPLASQSSRCNCQSRCWGVRPRSASLWCHITVCWGETLHVERKKQRFMIYYSIICLTQSFISALLQLIHSSKNGNVQFAQRNIFFSVMLLTCIMNSVPHLKTTDGARFVFIITLEDQLQTQTDWWSDESLVGLVKLNMSRSEVGYLPLLNLFPQVLELLQVQLSCPISLRKVEL